MLTFNWISYFILAALSFGLGVFHFTDASELIIASWHTITISSASCFKFLGFLFLFFSGLYYFLQKKTKTNFYLFVHLISAIGLFVVLFLWAKDQDSFREMMKLGEFADSISFTDYSEKQVSKMNTFFRLSALFFAVNVFFLFHLLYKLLVNKQPQDDF